MFELEPVRVAQIMGKLGAGGVESVIYNYYRHIDHAKIQFDFYIDDDSTVPMPQDILDAGARCIVIPRYQHLPQNMAALYRYFKREKYQIVHANLNTLSVFSLCAAWVAGVPVRIAHGHSTAGKGETKKNILKYILRPFAKAFATDYAACSKYAGQWLFGKRAMEQGRITVFNNAIDLDKFKYNEDVRVQVRKELGLEDMFVIGHVGRFTFQKNHEFLIDIFREVYKHDHNAVLLLVGDGDGRAKIEEKVKGLRVILLGSRTDVDRLYQAMDVFLLPSRYEGLPVVGVEAQAAGLPCIISDKVTRDTDIGGNVSVLPIEDPVEWAEKVLEMMADIAGKCREPAHLQGGFDVSTEGKKLEDYYMKLIKTRTGGVRGSDLLSLRVCGTGSARALEEAA